MFSNPADKRGDPCPCLLCTLSNDIRPGKRERLRNPPLKNGQLVFLSSLLEVVRFVLLFRQSNVLAPYWLFWKEPLFYYYLLTAQLEVPIFHGLSSHSWTFIFKSLVCNDTILTSSGSARGGYKEVRSAARHKQQATERL